ncbi:MAG: hypothetical protein IT305_25370 [Chloroflexi bacterium]|nr:hypothetical protein [Chloroflexota bacterium]
MNERIVAELGKLDGDTLLNSCFVEQKKLQRLESLDAAARRESLLRLLNLDNLTALESRFKVTSQDDRAIGVADARLRLATVRDEIPVRQAELHRAERRLAALHIRSALEKHAAATAGLAEVDQELIQLEEETTTLDDRLARIANLVSAERQVEAVGRTVERRQRAADDVSAHQLEFAALDRLADEELPRLETRRASLAILGDRLRRLETVEQGRTWLDEGIASASASSEAEDEMAGREAEKERVAARLQRLTALREADQSAERLAERLSQRAAAGAELARLQSAQGELEAVRDGLPVRRARVQSLVKVAADLDTAHQQRDQAEQQLRLVDDLTAAESALASATNERSDVARTLRGTTAQLTSAQQALSAARSARSPAVRPLIAAWIHARAAVDEGEAAAEAQDKANERLEWARQGLRRAESQRSATALRSTIGLAVGGVGLLAGTVLAALGLLLPGGAVAFVALAALAVGLRDRGRLNAGQQEVQKFSRAVELAQQDLADVNARLALGGSASDRLAEAERSLESVGERVPAGVDEARDRLAAADQRDRAAQAIAAREHELDEAVSRLTREVGQAEEHQRRSDQAVEHCAERVKTAREMLGAASGDVAVLRTDGARRLEQAQRALRTAQEGAVSLGAEPTAESARQLAAVAQSSIDQDGQKVVSIPSVASSVHAAGKRLDELTASLADERRSLDIRLAALGQEPPGDADGAWLTTLRQRIAVLMSDGDWTTLDQQRSRLEAAIGAASQRAEQCRDSARAAWQRAGEAGRLVAKDASAEAAELESGAALIRLADAALDGDEIDADSLRESASMRRQALVAEAERLEAPLAQDGLHDAVTVLETRQAQIGDQLAMRPSVVERRDAAVAQVAILDQEIDGNWEAIDGRLANLGGVAASRDAALLLADLESAREALDETGTRRRRDDVLAATANARSRASTHQAEQARTHDIIAGQLRAVGQDASVEPNREVLSLVLPDLDDPGLSDLDVLEAERRRLDGVIGGLGAEQQRLEGQWGLTGVELDAQECHSELERLKRDKAVKERATRIIRTARANLIGRVLPSTEHNLRLLLPHLTTQRYRDATLSDEYRLQVWDADAGRYVAKEIFSGGTKDQFSLALRLAFALATLPQELGTTPGFIFLDEPLSAFDQPRTAALVELLTTGQIAKSFAQIFLISHSRAFDPDLFPYYLRMHEGRVAETNLTSPLQVAS